MRTLLATLALLAFGGIAYADNLPAGKYIGNFGDGKCGILTVKANGSASYKFGVCQGKEIVQVEYTARSVKIKSAGKGYRITIDEARYDVSTAAGDSLLGKWSLGGTRTMLFKR